MLWLFNEQPIFSIFSLPAMLPLVKLVAPTKLVFGLSFGLMFFFTSYFIFEHALCNSRFISISYIASFYYPISSLSRVELAGEC